MLHVCNMHTLLLLYGMLVVRPGDLYASKVRPKRVYFVIGIDLFFAKCLCEGSIVTAEMGYLKRLCNVIA